MKTKILMACASLLVLAGVVDAASGGRLEFWRSTTQTSVPGTATSTHPYHWDDTAGNYRYSTTAGNNYVSACVPTTAGDYCGWNGTNWTREPAPTGGGSGGYSTIDNSGTPLTQRTTVNFTGAGVSCVDNSGSSRTDCTISGGGGGTLASSYNGTGTTGNTITETSAGGSVVIKASTAFLAGTPALKIEDSGSIVRGSVDESGDWTGSQFMNAGTTNGMGVGGTGLTLYSGGVANAITVPQVAGAVCLQADAETLSNKTLASPTLSGTVAGTYTLGGTPTLGNVSLPANWTATGASSAAGTVGITFQSNVTDSATSVGTVIDSAAMTSGVPLSIRNNHVEQWRVDGSGYLMSPLSIAIVGRESGGALQDGMLCTGGQVILRTAGQNTATAGGSGTTFLPGVDNHVTNGSATLRWKGLYNSAVLSGGYNAQSGTTYTIALSDFLVSMTSSSARTATLPAASTSFVGQIFEVKDGNGNAATNNVTVAPNGTDTIDGANTSKTISTNWGTLKLMCVSTTAWITI